MAQGRPLPCADYAAVSELKATTEKHCPRSSSQFGENSPSKSPKSRHPSLRSSPQTSPRATHVNLTPPAFLLPPPVPPPPAKLDHTARFSCSRASPLVCVNQSLCSALGLLRRSRALESNERSALSYARAIAVSLALPRLVGFSQCMPDRLSKVLLYTSYTPHPPCLWVIQPSRGKSRRGSAARYKSYLSLARRFPRWYAERDGMYMNLLYPGLDRRISISRTHSRSWCVLRFPPLTRDSCNGKTEETRQSERFISLSLFASIYGIGPVTARKLYDLGLRTMRDVEAYYEVNTGFTPAEHSDGADMDIRIALELHDELMQTCELTHYRDEMLTFAQHSPRRGRSHPRNDYGPSERRRAWLCRHHCWRVIVSLCPAWTVSFFSHVSSPDTVAGSLPATTSILCSRIRT
jgi:hypothetical protein